MKAMPINDGDGECLGHIIECPACGHGHFFNNAHGALQHPRKQNWDFNGNLESPSFTPSMLVTVPPMNGKPKQICHSFVTDGQIRFLNDCTHKYAGQTLELPEIEP